VDSPWVNCSGFRRSGIQPAGIQLYPGCTRQRLIAPAKVLQGFVVQLFQVKQYIVGALCRTDQFIQFDLYRFSIAVLRILNQKKP